MKRSLIAAALAVGIVIAAGPAGASTVERQTRYRDHIGPAIAYTGSWDQINPGNKCFDGKARHRTQVYGYTVTKGRHVMYCQSGWVTIQISEHVWVDVQRRTIS